MDATTLKNNIDGHGHLSSDEKEYLKRLIEMNEQNKKGDDNTSHISPTVPEVIEVLEDEEVEESELAVVRSEETGNNANEQPSVDKESEKELISKEGCHRKPYSKWTFKEKLEPIEGLDKVDINWSELESFKNGVVIIARNSKSSKYLIGNYSNNILKSLYIEGELVKRSYSGLLDGGLSELELINAVEILANQPHYKNKHLNLF